MPFSNHIYSQQISKNIQIYIHSNSDYTTTQITFQEK